ncbi:MAG: glycoside hydrolase family 125 protein [Candidatus Methylacidiphilales bacterium]|nr:glycoside hydrolase family 125 protein [Candidatus Methylacidiphilales bacterium]
MNATATSAAATSSLSFPCQRPAPAERRFSSPAVEATLAEVSAAIADPELAWMFNNCFPSTLDTTVFFEDSDAEGNPDTYVITGDIPAMWLRDSAAQVWPFLPLVKDDATLKNMIAGVIRRQARGIVLDPYANAFYREATLGEWQTDLTQMLPGVHERKWELDSLGWFLRLSHGYWKTTGDLSPLDDTWLKAVAAALAVMEVEQDGPARSPYTFMRQGVHNNSLNDYGHGDPVKPCGLVRSAFRPSDDACKLPFLVPSNALAAVALTDIGPILAALGQPELSAKALRFSQEIRDGLEKVAVARHAELGELWSYEVDGFGSSYLMDDANVPSLISLPYLGFCAYDDARYLRTRAFCLSTHNPYYSVGTVASGIGGPHTGSGSIWPMSLILQALTSLDDEEILTCLRALKATHAGTGFMHESFRAEDPSRFTRKWFAWANTLFGELIVTLHATRPHLLKTSL